MSGWYTIQSRRQTAEQRKQQQVQLHKQSLADRNIQWENKAIEHIKKKNPKAFDTQPVMPTTAKAHHSPVPPIPNFQQAMPSTFHQATQAFRQ